MVLEQPSGGGRFPVPSEQHHRNHATLRLARLARFRAGPGLTGIMGAPGLPQSNAARRPPLPSRPPLDDPVEADKLSVEPHGQESEQEEPT